MVLLGEESVLFDTYHVSKGYGTIIPEELSILDLCSTADLAVSNTFFEKNKSKLITFSSLQLTTTYKLVLVKRSFFKHLRDVKVIYNEKYGSRKIPLGTFPPGKFLPIKLPPRTSPRKFPPRIFPPISLICLSSLFLHLILHS